MQKITAPVARYPDLFRSGFIPGVWLVFAVLVSVLWSQQAAARSLPDFTELVEENSSAVVNISTTSEPAGRRSRFQGLPFDEEQLDQLPPFLQDFFRGPNSPFGGAPGNPSALMNLRLLRGIRIVPSGDPFGFQR